MYFLGKILVRLHQKLTVLHFTGYEDITKRSSHSEMTSFGSDQ